jgi:hypothetical protein
MVWIVALGWSGDAVAQGGEQNEPCSADYSVTIWPTDKAFEVNPDALYAIRGDVVRFQNRTDSKVMISFMLPNGTVDTPFESAVVFYVEPGKSVCQPIAEDAAEKEYSYKVSRDGVEAQPRIIIRSTAGGD